MKWPGAWALTSGAALTVAVAALLVLARIAWVGWRRRRSAPAASVPIDPERRATLRKIVAEDYERRRQRQRTGPS